MPLKNMHGYARVFWRTVVLEISKIQEKLRKNYLLHECFFKCFCQDFCQDYKYLFYETNVNTYFRQPHKMVRDTQNNSSAKADELFECFTILWCWRFKVFYPFYFKYCYFNFAFIIKSSVGSWIYLNIEHQYLNSRISVPPCTSTFQNYFNSS